MHKKQLNKKAFVPLQDGKIAYMLRRTPREWRMNTDDDIDEAVEFCRKHKIDEVMWFIESAAAYHAFVDTDDVRARKKWFTRAREKLNRAGILQSFNILFVIGHGEYGYNLSDRFETMVGHDGRTSSEILCPLSPAWLAWIKQFFEALAETKPARLWVDDDFRYFGHGGISMGCYCQRHLREFARRMGVKSVAREELVAAILRPGKPHPWRRTWMDLMHDSLAAAAQTMRAAVQGVSPETQLALMVTTPFILEIEGRDLPVLLRDLSAPHRPIIRMCNCGYAERNFREYYLVDESLKRFRPMLTPDTHKCTEIESIPYYLYNKSAAWLERQIEWATVLDVPNHTLNLYDRMTTPFADQPAYGRMLRDLKPRLQAIASVTVQTPGFRGVRLFSDKRASLRVHTTVGKQWPELLPHDSGWADALRAFGFPVQFESDEEVCALTGEAPRLVEDRLEEIFRKGVLLDLSALETLRDMGAEKWAGVRIRKILDTRIDKLHGYERLDDPAFGGGQDHRTAADASSISRRLGVLEPSANARVISWIEEGESRRNLFPGVFLCENKLGGRVCVFPYEFINRANPDMYLKGTGIYFYSECRRRQLRGVVDWLARGRASLSVEAPGWILPHRADGPAGIFLAVMNINLDPWPEIKLSAWLDRRKVKAIRELTARGTWQTLPVRFWRPAAGRLLIYDKRPCAPLNIRCYFAETT